MEHKSQKAKHAEGMSCRGWRKERSSEATPGGGRHREGRETVIMGLSPGPQVS